MGKRVFEVAKDLGIDHRDVLKRCDALGIKVRNYMSVLNAGDEARLRSAYEGGRKVVETMDSSGVVRRRRRKPGANRSGSASRTPGRPAGRGPSSGRDETPASRGPSARPGVRRIGPARPVRPAAEESPRRVSSPRAAQPDAAPSPRPASPQPAAEKRSPRPAPSEQKPAAEATRKPAAEPSPRPVSQPAAGAGPRSKPAAAEAKPQAPSSPESRGPSKPGRRGDGGARVLYRPEPTQQREEPRTARPSLSSPPRKRPTKKQPADGPTIRRPERAEQRPPSPRPRVPSMGRSDGPKVRRPDAAGRGPSGGNTRREEARNAGAQIRHPSREGGTAAPVAKVLGRIPLDQLQRRTARPPSRRRGGPPGSGPRRRPSGPARGGPGRPPMRRGPQRGPGMAAPPPPPPGGGGASTRNRRRTGGPSRDNDRARSTQRNSRRRRVFNREDIYQGGSGRHGRTRRRKMSSRRGAKTQLTTPAAHKRVVRVDETISVGELGKALGVKANELLRKLMGMGMMATINQQVDLDTAALLATEYDYEVKNVAFQEDDVLSGPADVEIVEDDPEAIPRAPVVTIMGHVDHGKTTLLDRIRKANVADGEAGGITQHIGAYLVPVGDDGPGVVFLDTPGHAAFTAMRARGASVTDVVVLVVAADDGVMPQTEESISHAKASGVPIVVAVNKIDKPGVDPERIKQELTKYELVPEEWGGETIFVNVSGLTGQGVDDLLESLALQAEILELKANPDKPAYGRVVEARLDKRRGTVCTVLVQQGTLRKGDFIVSGNHSGRVRALMNDQGKRVDAAGPSTPVEVLGLGGMPAAGDAFYTAKNEKDAKKVVASRDEREARAAAARATGPGNAADLFAALSTVDKEIQNVILKTDVSGSLEALRSSLDQLATDEVAVKLVHAGVGAISESDVDLAVASNALVIGFNTQPDTKSKRLADQGGVEVMTFSVIYDVLDVVKDKLSGLLSPEIVEERLGEAEVRAVFHIQKVGTVAGCFVLDGKVQRNAMARVKRAGELVHSGKVTTLKRFKDDVREVNSGYECGLSIDNYKDAQEGDIVEVYEVKEVRRKID